MSDERTTIVKASTIGNLTRNALRPGYLRVMSRKVVQRVGGREDPRGAKQWATTVAEDLDQFCASRNPEVWAEAQQFAAEFESAADAKLAALDVQLGGPGAFAFLHFLSRRLPVPVAVETGVAAGWSSAAILDAFERNAEGHLYSSDFPYFRLPDPERYIGILVEPRHQPRWTLRTEGDHVNLPAFMPLIDQIGLVHYDSDKTTEGRRFAMDLLLPKMAPGGFVVMDDIQDTTFFRDWTEAFPGEWHVFGVGSKFIGVAVTPRTV